MILGLYLYTVTITHKSCNILSTLNKLTLQKKWQYFVTNNVFRVKKIKTKQQEQEKSKNYRL